MTCEGVPSMADTSIPAGRSVKCCTVLPTLSAVAAGEPYKHYVNLPGEVAGREIVALLISGVYQKYYTAGVYSADGITFKGWSNDFTTSASVTYEKSSNRLLFSGERFDSIGYSIIIYQ